MNARLLAVGARQPRWIEVYRAWAILAGHPYHRGGDS